MIALSLLTAKPERCVMARMSRAEVFDSNEVSIAHVCSRTVRRCCLMGNVPNSPGETSTIANVGFKSICHNSWHISTSICCASVCSRPPFHLIFCLSRAVRSVLMAHRLDLLRSRRFGRCRSVVAFWPTSGESRADQHLSSEIASEVDGHLNWSCVVQLQRVLRPFVPFVPERELQTGT